jgi:glycosyltransferase involved in cell wall biosynthesis
MFGKNLNAEVDGQIAVVRARISRTLASYRRQSNDLQRQTELWSRRSEARRNGSYRVLNRMLRACDFAEKCLAAAEQLRSPVYICQSVESVLAAHSLRSNDAMIVLDLIEAPFYRLRWNCIDRPIDPFVYALDRAVAGLLSLTDIAMAASTALGEELQQAGARISLLPDYPLPRPFTEAPGVREACNLAPTDRLAVLFDRGDEGRSCKPVFRALAHLPDNYHLAIIGNGFHDCAAGYKRELDDQLAAEQLAGRVHRLPPVAAEQLPTYAGGADVGVIGLDPAHSGERLLLPRCLFDCIAARLPVAAADLPEIQQVLTRHGAGLQFDPGEPRSVAATLKTLMQEKERLRPGLDRAARELVWSRNERVLMAPFAGIGAVTMLCAEPHADHDRTGRIASTLVDHGIEVTIARAVPNDTLPAAAPRQPEVPRTTVIDIPIDI